MGSGLERDSNYFDWLDDRKKGVQMKESHGNQTTLASEIHSNEGEEVKPRFKKEPVSKVRKLAQSWLMASQAEMQSRRALGVAYLSLVISISLVLAYIVL